MVSTILSIHNSGMTTETFGEWLATQRKRRKLRQADLSRDAGVNATYISKIERGDIDLPGEETRAKFHAALGTTEEDLVTAGILERIDSPVAGGLPVYIAADHITPGDRAAAAARMEPVRLDAGAPYVIGPDDPRYPILAMLDNASPAKLEKVRQLVGVLSDLLP